MDGPAPGYEPRPSARADVDLHLLAEFGPLANFPSVRTDLSLDWQYSLDEGAGDPAIQFRNVELNLGEFFTNFAGGVLEKVEEVIEPIRPIIDTLIEFDGAMFFLAQPTASPFGAPGRTVENHRR